MRHLAIGDIHGCRRSLEVLLEEVGLREDDTLVILGDMVDRGPDTKGVIEILMGLAGRVNLVCLRGNHEEVMLQAPGNRRERHFWLQIGGVAVLESYGAMDFTGIPRAHWEFLEATRPWYETDRQIFVHANLDPFLALEDQPPPLLYWERFETAAAHKSGKVMICGHTSQPSGLPATRGDYAVCIDTGACRGGWLTCLDPDRGFYWQANEAGDIRTDVLDAG